jgi:photosystem II stability/assembly factor-like uncharacterized protein
MKKNIRILINSLLVFGMLFILTNGCKKDTPQQIEIPPSIDKQTSEIEGLKLTYLKTNLPNNFNTIFFVDETIGYIAGYNGAIYKTSDAGITWNKLFTDTTLPLYDIYFFNDKEGFAVGGESMGAIIIHTIDGGITWARTSIKNAEKTELRSICFVTDSLGFAVGGGTILITKNRGLNWNGTKMNNLGGYMSDVAFINEKEGFIAITSGKMAKTIDGGLNWSISIPFPEFGVETLSLLNKNIIFSANYTIISKSTDFGATWSSLYGYKGETFKLIFKSEKIGYSFGRGKYSGGDFGHDYGAINYTVDGGNTWKGNDKLKEIRVIEDASFPTEDVGFAISYNIVIKIKKQ